MTYTTVCKENQIYSDDLKEGITSQDKKDDALPQIQVSRNL